MPRVLDITGEYPPDWKAISDRTWAAAGSRCIRCGHPYAKGEHGKGEWSPCDVGCSHFGPFGIFVGMVDGYPKFNQISDAEARDHRFKLRVVCARWRIGTVHHLDGNKSNCTWWNLLALCQRCHLNVQARVNPQQPYMLDHSAWFKPYVAGFYAKKYEGRDITREQAEAELERLLAWERIA